MDVSPKTLREVEFREKMRGYHPEDVDQFLERVAAGIEVLQDRLRQAIERAQRAEQAATEAGGNDDSLRRTLLLAQRTADMAVQEGREQAARLVSGAEAQAQSLMTEAEQQVRNLVAEAERRAQSVLADSEYRSQTMVSEAEQRARRGHEDTLVEVRAELAKLEVSRQRLQMDVDGLTRWVQDHRNQLRAALEDALTRAEQIDMNPPPVAGGPLGLQIDSVPNSSGVPVDVPAQGVTATGGGLSAAAPAVGPLAPPPAPASPPPAAWAPPAGSAVPAQQPLPTQQPVPTQQFSGRAPEDTGAWQRPEPDVVATDEAGDADPYFAELRRAISDNDPLGPRPQDSKGAGAYPTPGADA